MTHTRQTVEAFGVSWVEYGPDPYDLPETEEEKREAWFDGCADAAFGEPPARPGCNHYMEGWTEGRRRYDERKVAIASRQLGPTQYGDCDWSDEF